MSSGSNKMVSSETELIRALLDCGYSDIKTMTNIMEMGEILLGENPIEKVVDNYYDKINFNSILYDAMNFIVYNLAMELDNADNSHTYCDILDTYWKCPYVNYMDSHFQIECLDDWEEDISKEKLMEQFKADLLEMKLKG